MENEDNKVALLFPKKITEFSKEMIFWCQDKSPSGQKSDQNKKSDLCPPAQESKNVLPELTQETKKVLAEPTQETKIKLPELAQETEKALPELAQE